MKKKIQNCKKKIFKSKLKKKILIKKKFKLTKILNLRKIKKNKKT